jgi:N-acetylmuramoyl-L-alanine amidase
MKLPLPDEVPQRRNQVLSYNSDQALEISLLVLVVGREARGEIFAAKLGVAWSIRNRVERPRWWGHDWLTVIEKRAQYSSMEPPSGKDPNLIVYPDLANQAWRECIEAAEAAYWESQPDPTSGATHYYDRSIDDHPPQWATDSSSEHVRDIGNLHFYKMH